MTPGILRILVALKARLMLRALARRGGVRAVALLLAIAAVFAPMWLGLTAAAYGAARSFGAPAVVAGLGLVHFAWIGASLMFGSFAEGFDLRLLLRYPVPPRAAFWLNVLVAPVDFVALFLLPPLGALAAGAGARAGLAAGIVVAGAGVLVLFVTTAIAQALIALLGRHLRREWTRALMGLALGVLFAIPAIGLRYLQPDAGTHGPVAQRAALAWLAQRLPAIERAFSWYPPTAAAARAAVAGIAGGIAAAAGWLLVAAAVLALVVEICARLAVGEALNREAVTSRSDPGGPEIPRLDSWLERLLPTDLAMLVARDLRTYVRTPQILLGLFTAPFLVVMFSRTHDLAMRGGTFLVALAPLITALNLASNQFGLDQAGVKLLFLLPVAARRLLIAKNIACTTITLAGAITCLATTFIAGPRFDLLGVVTTLATLAAALPVVLAFGNHLSVRSPWRMSFRLGGAPPGAMSSAFAQMAAVGVVALLLTPGLLLLPQYFGTGLAVRAGSLWITATLAAILWSVWLMLLPRTAAALESRREMIIDRLARASEVG
jgi:hypothetical protein